MKVPFSTSHILAIFAIVLCVAVLLFYGTKPRFIVPEVIAPLELTQVERNRAPAVMSKEELAALLLNAVPKKIDSQKLVEEPVVQRKKVEVVPFKYPKPEPGEKVKVAIIIDDMGMDRRRGYELIEMGVPLTLAFLPYAPSLKGITEDAKKNGHELMIHMPMQAMKKQDLGDIHLHEDMDDAAKSEALEQAFEAFDGYVGLNNHMGSRLTQNADAMELVMKQLRKRDLYFVDSKTISTSVAGNVARANGLRAIDRDVFLDHENTISFVRNALLKAEKTARKQGYAVVIGHPKDATINGLKEWVPLLEERNIELVHVSELFGHKSSEPRVTDSKPVIDPVEALLKEPAGGQGTLQIDLEPELTGGLFQSPSLPRE